MFYFCYGQSHTQLYFITDLKTVEFSVDLNGIAVEFCYL
jgi:hypothetical protein